MGSVVMDRVRKVVVRKDERKSEKKAIKRKIT